MGDVLGVIARGLPRWHRSQFLGILLSSLGGDTKDGGTGDKFVGMEEIQV